MRAAYMAFMRLQAFIVNAGIGFDENRTDGNLQVKL